MTFKQLHLKPEFWTLAAAMKVLVLSMKRVQSAPSFMTVCIEQKSSMDAQKETLPPAATGPSEELPIPAKHQKMLNPNAPEWWSSAICPTAAAAANAAPPTSVSIHGIDNQTRIYFT